MWIPEFLQRDDDIILAVTTAAEALITARGTKEYLTALYLALVKRMRNEVPLTVNVATSPHYGEGFIQITPVEAYLLHREGLLGQQQNENRSGYGSMDSTRLFSSRALNMVKFYGILNDDSLPKPTGRIVQLDPQ